MVHQLKVKLKDIRPVIWRRIQVNGSTTLYKLHDILQVAMGWENCHLYEFEIAGRRYGPPDDEFAGMAFGEPAVDDKKAKLSEVAPVVKCRLLYTYDFGDGWEHDVTVEKILPDEKGGQYPVCLAGERACPPEDCGGPWGYADLLEAIEHPDDPDSEELLEWAGDFDPEKFNIDQINKRLKKIK
jgi:hypothetical protein